MTAKTAETPIGLYDYLERLFREHITDEDARRDAFACLKELRIERAALILGLGAVLRYFESYNEFPQEDKPRKPATCPISKEAMDELYLWQAHITAEIHPAGST